VNQGKLSKPLAWFSLPFNKGQRNGKKIKIKILPVILDSFPECSLLPIFSQKHPNEE